MSPEGVLLFALIASLLFGAIMATMIEGKRRDLGPTARFRIAMFSALTAGAVVWIPAMLYLVDSTVRWRVALYSLIGVAVVGILVFLAASEFGRRAEKQPDSRMVPWMTGAAALLFLMYTAYELLIR